MRVLLIRLSVAAACFAGIASASAHHSFAAEFDSKQKVEFTGVVTKVEWTNPHARFYVDGKDPESGSEEVFHWNIELVSANVLMRQGWRPNSLKVGDTVTVMAARARKDPHVVNATSVVGGDGNRLFSRIPGQTTDNQ
jgi:Family of unknown function (DUF6152)